MNESLATKMKFFEPTKKWIEWMFKRYGENRFVVDCGAGLGHVTHALRKAGMKKAIAIELYTTAEFLKNYTGFYTADACNFPFTKEMVPMFCRPCHDGFVSEAIQNAHARGCREFIYISKPENFSRDIFDLPSGMEANSVEMVKIGKESEVMWLITESAKPVKQVEKDASFYTYSEDKIPADAMLGIEWLDDDGGEMKTASRVHKESGKREVELSLSSFVGTIAFGAMHYYAKMRASTSVINSEGHFSGGYLGKACPIKEREILINATRRITKVEKDMGGTPIGKIGEQTYRFNTEKEAFNAALRMFKKRFGPGWCLVLRDYVDDYEELQGKVVAET